MPKIAFFNDFQLPLPAVKGGSVPTLTNFLLDQNEIYGDFEIDVYSCFDKEAEKQSKNYKHTKFIYSKAANLVRFSTNIKFVLKNKLHLPLNVKSIKLPQKWRKFGGGGIRFCLY